jgi:8-amino-7-oxononanoate synthase
MDEQFLADKLLQRTNEGNLRRLSFTPNLKDFVSNDYLGLANNEALKATINTEILASTYSHGSTGSRLLSGNNPLVCDFETYLADLFDAEACLLFNSGYVANLALVSAVAEKGDTILYDQLSHVCLKEGAWLSKADTFAFSHNDLDDLASRIKRAKGKIFVLTETIFSMDGDIAPIEKIVSLCAQYGCYLIVDEAHSTGIYGHYGSGLLAEMGLNKDVFGRVYTFGKAIGAHGACVAGSRLLIDYLINFARPFIYTTALPPHAITTVRASFEYLKSNAHLPSILQNNIDLFRSEFGPALSKTAIQPVIVGSNEKAKAISLSLKHAGFDVRPILSPTVRKGSERLRISLHTHNSEDDIMGLCSCLKKLI